MSKQLKSSCSIHLCTGDRQLIPTAYFTVSCLPYSLSKCQSPKIQVVFQLSFKMTDNLDKLPASQDKRPCLAATSTWHMKEREKALLIWSTGRNPTEVFLLITQLIEKEMMLFRKQGLSCPNELTGNRWQAMLVKNKSLGDSFLSQ